MPGELSVPTCETGNCDTECLGPEDGWEETDGTLRCADCWGYWEYHGHWPDEDEDCHQCRTEGDDGE